MLMGVGCGRAQFGATCRLGILARNDDLKGGHVGDTGLENCIYSPVEQDEFDLRNGAFSGKSLFHRDSRQWIGLVPNDADTSSTQLLQKGFGSLVYLVNPVVLLSIIF